MQKLLGKQQSLGLDNCDGCYAERIHREPPQLPGAKAGPGGELVNAISVRDPGADRGKESLLESCVARVVGRSGRGEFRSAAQARPETGALGGGGRFQEQARAWKRSPRRADGTAVDPRGFYADVKASVETGVAGAQGLIIVHLLLHVIAR